MATDLDNRSGTAAWQSRLLPLMTRMIVGLTIFFFVASLAQLVYLHWNVRHAPVTELSDEPPLLERAVERGADAELAAFRARSAVQLELYSINRRYHQANVLLMARVWTRYLGFVTGMILALVGAVFILGKLETSESTISAEGAGTAYSIKSASPGVIMACLGVILMITTIVTHHEITTEDRPVYLRTFAEPGAATEADLRDRLQRPESDGLQRPEGERMDAGRVDTGRAEEASPGVQPGDSVATAIRLPDGR